MSIEDCPVPGVEFKTVAVNGIRMRLAMAGGTGPLILLAHGWPESWYSWRHQLLFFSSQGYRVVAPDMRGYGGSDAPEDESAYDIYTLSADLVGIVEALDETTAILVGHDWGAIVAWHAALLYPDRFSDLVTMSVPYAGRPRQSPMAFWRQRYGENFFYILYHNAPGAIAKQEYDSDPRGLLSRLYQSPGARREPPRITDKHYSAGGWIGRLGAPRALPDWLSQADLDYVVRQFEQSGFRGGLNYYRNFQRNWELTARLKSHAVTVPTLFLAGARDMVLAGADAQKLRAAMEQVVIELYDVKILPGFGHWIQQEAPEQINAAMRDFLRRPSGSAQRQ